MKDLAGFDCDDMTLAIRAAGCLLGYVRETQRTDLPHITRVQRLSGDEAIHIDGSSRRNLELTVNIHGTGEHTLDAVINRTTTAMGRRMLQRWITFVCKERSSTCGGISTPTARCSGPARP